MKNEFLNFLLPKLTFLNFFLPSGDISPVKKTLGLTCLVWGDFRPEFEQGNFTTLVHLRGNKYPFAVGGNEEIL
jgi:hypothetical protein